MASLRRIFALPPILGLTSSPRKFRVQTTVRHDASLDGDVSSMFALITNNAAIIAQAQKPEAGVVVCGNQVGMAKAPHAINPRDTWRPDLK